jgi:hypothetical protein
MSLLVVGVLVYQVEQTNQSLAGQVDVLQAQIQDLKDRWYGTPAIYQPPAIANTDIVFFDVKGSTQGQLIDSLNHSDLCTKYPPCAADPANPTGVAWGLEGFKLVNDSIECRSAATTTVAFREMIVLPKWTPPADGTIQTSLVKKWNALAKAINTHEAGHVTITQKDVADLNHQAQQLPACAAVLIFWDDSHVFDKLEADQAAYHSRLRADCRPEIGCIPPGWMGW